MMSGTRFRAQSPANTPLAGMVYATPIALVLWALIALAAIKIF